MGSLPTIAGKERQPMKNAKFSLDQLTSPKKTAPAKKAAPKRKHWSDDFLKHLDAWGAELRKSKKKARA